MLLSYIEDSFNFVYILESIVFEVSTCFHPTTGKHVLFMLPPQIRMKIRS